ncbi:MULTISPECIES: thermostable hemolysin [unclassified Alcanivorax]|uniref:thermostable hemolysin n=1 Tax=unclassified Alcanivorax TaxID=2638842 RepID=UPI0008A05D0B|nr:MULTISPECIES: thermostable hemolysin [unclassified Alcanivorax]MEE3387497.1 thermostable hemolysin [Pseudomonadota bacterium]MBB09586.1 thermostable hemolysin [Alcanivorax sp.]MBU84426.1 thermostable hemolysin [Alcanivorax sp.]MCK5887693.1 thermostable hemolysin [Alcanivorax sp.]SEF76107.1 Thermostable hemolysin [Alcanivorax sp. DSM 26293]|tara:strand:+ start:424 stop:1098 length:675 start_codon:yes stop_codon:yes gene_type:complete
MKLKTLSPQSLHNAMASPLSLHGQSMTCRVLTSTDDGYQRAAHFIRRYYRMAFAARPHINATFLVSLEDSEHRLRAVVGLNPAAGRSLFLEQYLDAPLEAHMADHYGVPVGRDDIVEVASLAADGSGAGRLLFVALTEGLYHLGRDWIAFTATAQVRTMFSRLGLRPHAIAEADPARLGDDASRWGRYYQFRPQVMVGHVPPGYATLTRNGWLGTGGLGYGVVA